MSFMLSNSTFSLKEYGLVSEDDRFAMGMACGWLKNLLRSGVNLDSSMLRLLGWIHNGAEEAICRVACERCAVRPALRKNGEELAEAEDRDARLFVFDRIMALAHGELRLAVRKAALEMLSRVDFHPDPDMHLVRAITNFQKVFDLSELETRLCLFLYVLATWSECEQYFEDTLKCNGRTNHTVLAILLDTSLFKLRRVMNGKLDRLAILERNISGRVVFNSLYSRFFEDCEPERVAESLFETLAGNPVPLDEYILDAGDRECILELLRNAGDVPTHILLHGVPGAGKTSFAHSLAHALGVPAYNVPISRGKDDMPRATGIEACLNMTNGGRNALVIADEADVLLNTLRGYLLSGERQDKGWLNELLERPGVRIVWITNSIEDVEDSVLRRFSYNMKFTPLTAAQREVLFDRILRKHKVKSLVPSREIRGLVREYPVSAGVVDLSVRQARAMCGRDAGRFVRTLRRLLAAAQSLAEDRAPGGKRFEMEEGYSLDGLNFDTDIKALMRDLERYDAYLKSGRNDLILNRNVLLYGPPGTGKTAFAKYVASRLGRRLLVRRASDLLSKWVGGTEENLARAFAEAEREGHVLLVDEADSFISSRDQAMHRWEISHVNEFLTQMETFRGILICSTNRADELDAASRRRFTHKIRVDYLTRHGNLVFFDKILGPYFRGKLNGAARSRLAGLADAAPGDFKVVRDKIVLEPRGTYSGERLLQMLEEEVAAKRRRRPCIGF
ncbi:AAA ATPase central domain protein [Pseudodesulfovibrio mercurii]|uniref:AAA ATPase central domain protein n=1 Tax=Pseudodesulfovibrio mercurii TaxID=641491 RepID=F0JCI6_9BACT|nr:ATP-binding protein [Pseudodesulfovibrio mercurii]EGB15666.1 AAA ATPase central domain protein [Pseudodesulfovibrio mercurii]